MNANDINESLVADNRHSKINALHTLQSQCADTERTLTELQQIFDECYLYLLKCYADRHESVREQTVVTVTQFVERLPPNDFHLVNIVATLGERMGLAETVETSEEVRLLYVAQLKLLVTQYATTGKMYALETCYADMVRVLNKALRDSFPAVQREACDCIVTLAATAETSSLQTASTVLSKALYPMLNHKHSLARTAAVRALSRVALHLNASDDSLRNLLMSVTPLLMDSAPLVRRECGELGVILLLELKDRYSYFDRILPLVLCCLKDDSPDVVSYIRPLWVKCGRLYYDENETELRKQELADALPGNYPLNLERPTIGCRGLVQRSLRLLAAITREIHDWKENVRIHCLKLLYQFVLHAEAALTAKFFEIYPDLERAFRDKEPEVVAEAIKVADLMGRLLTYEEWCEHGFAGLERSAKEGYLKCFYYMFTASQGPKLDDLLRVSKILIQPDFSQNLKHDFQKYVIRMVETLLLKLAELKLQKAVEGLTLDAVAEKVPSEEDCQIVQLLTNLYITTIKVMALSLNVAPPSTEEKLEKRGWDILERIANLQDTTVSLLHEENLKYALADIDGLDAPLEGNCEPVLLLHGLIVLCKLRVPYLPLVQQKVLDVWQNCADDAKLKIFTGLSVACLCWSESINRELAESVASLKSFLIAVVETHLQWHPGANAEAMRSMATATLCSISEGAEQEARLVLPLFSKYLVNLLEDQAVATRHYAIKCLFNFGELPIEDLKPIAYACLQRLDDPSRNLRELAIRALSKLHPKFEKEKIEDKSDDRTIWEVFVKQAFDMLFLHYEGPDAQLKSAIRDTIKVFAAEYPEICKDSFNRIVAMSYGSGDSCLVELKEELPFKV